MRGINPHALGSSQVSSWHGAGAIVVPSRDRLFNALAFDKANLLAWYSGDAVNGLGSANPAADAAVSTWYDLSGNGRNQTVTGTANYRQGGLNGLPAVQFAASAKSKSANFTHSAQWTIYAVVQMPWAGSGVQGIIDADTGATRQAQYLRWNSTGLDSIAFNTGGSGFTATKSSTTTATAVSVLSAVCTTTSVQVWQNNSGSTATTLTGTGQSASLWLGLNSASDAANTGGGYFAQVALYTGAHSTATRQAIQSAMALQYSIPIA